MVQRSEPPRRRSQWRRAVVLVVALLLAYGVGAYVLLPAAWERYARRHPSLDDIPGVTRTGADIPGDPLNVALIGTKSDLTEIMLPAKWYPADPLTLRSSLEHVRFWRSDRLDLDGRPVWVGAAVYDRGVGLSSTTGQITHRHSSSDRGHPRRTSRPSPVSLPSRGDRPGDQL